jgi:phosphoribosylformylglycinamidine cyclo-ligase
LSTPILCMTMKRNKKTGTSYENAGVSIDRGIELVERIKSVAKDTFNSGVLGDLGGFGALFDLSAYSYRDPVLVSGTDGVGTKIKLAIELQEYDTIGVDLVAMCVNDLLVQGARPLFFLDYLACSKLDVDIAARIIGGIADGCRQAGCALIGGETAEMPGMYTKGDYDLAGFCVGAVERSEIIDGSRVEAGDVLIGLAASGPHANGYSLIRKIINESGSGYKESLGNKSIGELLMCPTRIYVNAVLELIKNFDVRALAHITGGGLIENIPRVLPVGVDADIDTGTWCMPPIFKWIQKTGNLASQEMFRIFNCGVGMVICVKAEKQNAVLECLAKAGETAWIVGKISRGKKDRPVVNLTGSN